MRAKHDEVILAFMEVFDVDLQAQGSNRIPAHHPFPVPMGRTSKPSYRWRINHQKSLAFAQSWWSPYAGYGPLRGIENLTKEETVQKQPYLSRSRCGSNWSVESWSVLMAEAKSEASNQLIETKN